MISSYLNNACTLLRGRGIFETLEIYRHILQWRFWRDWSSRQLVVRRINGSKMYLSLREPGISETLYKFGSREPEHIYILERILTGGMCVLDLGGNIGYYTLLMAQRVGAAGKIYAVEPAVPNFRLLTTNVAANGLEDRVELVQIAISNCDGERELHLSEQSNLHSFHDVVDPDLCELLELKRETATVKTVDLFTFVKERRRPDLIRMDVEGHEVEILESLARVAKIENWFPSVLFEVHPAQYDAQAHDICRVLSSLFEIGYVPALAASNKEPASGLQQHSHQPVAMTRDGNRFRGIYSSLLVEDVLKLVYERDQIRCLLLAHKDSAVVSKVKAGIPKPD